MHQFRSERDRAQPDRDTLAGFRAVNLVILGAGVVSLIVGYILLGRGSITAAPLILVFGYAVLIPTGILWGVRDGAKAHPGSGAGE